MSRPGVRGSDRAVRVAARGGVIGPILFALLVIVGGFVSDGYSHAGQKISELGGDGAEHALLQNLNFVVLGVSVIGFSWALARIFGLPFRGPVLIGFFGAVAVIHGLVLPCDVGCKGQTTAGLLHNVTGLAGFVATIAGMLVMARRWQNDPDWQPHVGFTRRVALVAIGGLVWFVVTQALDMQSLAGIAQRVFAGALLLWIAVTSARLVRAVSMTSVPESRVTAERPT